MYKMRRASSILKEIQRDREFIERLERRRAEDRIHYLMRHKRDMGMLTNLKRNWLLVEINEFVDLNICPFFRFNSQSNKQYCRPDHIKLGPDDILDMDSRGVAYTFEETECNCDLAEVKKKGCQKMMMLTG